MKKLYLIRHAKSDWSDPALDDFDRPLNKRGKKEVVTMGEFLLKNKIIPDLIISSSALRAKKTAKSIAKIIGYKKDNIHYKKDLYMADTADMERVLNEVDSSAKTVFLVGHNPEITEFANYISGYGIDTIPTCGVFGVSLIKKSWKSLTKNGAKFISFDYPKKESDS